MKLATLFYTITFTFFLCAGILSAQSIPSRSVIVVDKLPEYLKKEIYAELSAAKPITESQLAAYFRQKFSERFFYDWQSAEERFAQYNSLFDNREAHIHRAEDHLAKYADSTQWVLPFNYLNGTAVNAYALRHLARQHKMVDIAYLYYYDDKDPRYINYFTRQMQSLNAALKKGEYEKIADGNGVYEVFRSGYRILNWLSIHNLFLGQEAYTDQDQLYTIATLLQHGAHLYEHNADFQPGNHQTRGMSALAMLAILLRDFEGTDHWYERAMSRLGEHLAKEINADGFQFERSVHYHISDIGNYFYVYQLAQINDIKVGGDWEEKLLGLFKTLAMIAFPDKSAPVLQDDTDDPWAEKNNIAGTMTLGYLLFNDSEFGYFAENKVESKIYWFLQKQQLQQLESIERKQPATGSLHFPETGYYIMREGWQPDDKMMIISAGLDAEKPDHQHGDMLGIQAMANGNVLLPNYQVRYSLPDFQFFKNSMVKNVALVDDELQGKSWTGNKGNSGFGKFRELPNPTVIAWKNNDAMDLFVGSHDGFQGSGVDYTRQVIYVKDDFWIVKDNFKSAEAYTYRQVWQGHYTTEHAPQLLRSSFPDGSGCDLYQLHMPDSVSQDGTRGKQWSVVSRKGQNNFNFITIIYPFSQYGERIDETADSPLLKGWKLNDLPFDAGQCRSVASDDEAFIFEVENISLQSLSIGLTKKADLFIQWQSDRIVLQHIGDEAITLNLAGRFNEKAFDKKEILKPGDTLEIK